MNVLKRSNHPIIIGVGQITHREKILHESVSVIDLLKMAIDSCVEDTGRSDILKFVDSLSVVGIFSEHLQSPIPKICERIPIHPAFCEETSVGGNNPQWLVNRAADKIAGGDLKVALLVGGEALYRDRHFRQILDWQGLYDRYENDPSILGEVRRGESAFEVLHRADRATHIYPLFENSLRSHLNMTLTEHRTFLRTYFSNMSALAAENPYAWNNRDIEWDDITEPTENNPLYNFPYTKYMNPVISVNQAAALILTDTNTARRLEIPPDKWVYPHGGAEAVDKWYVSERVSYHTSPVIRFTAESALRSSDLDLSDIDFFDLYSCFPCAAIIGAMEIGLPINELPPLSITGGLCRFGGPGNNYTMHSIAHAVERLRKNPEEFGLVTGVGYYLTKHAVGIYSGVEPEKAWGREPKETIQARIDALESPIFCEKPEGPATVETYTVLHDTPDGKPFPIIIARLDSGERCLATTREISELAVMMEQEEFIGYKGHVKSGDPGPNIFS
jgi:acetyl-CoA C-acetyltransferase